jgi:hypothetical protein
MSNIEAILLFYLNPQSSIIEEVEVGMEKLS